MSATITSLHDYKIDLKENVGFINALKMMVPGSCSTYTFPGGLLAFFTLLLLIALSFATYGFLKNGEFGAAGASIALTLFLSLPTIYINAYLRKGCELAQIINAHNDKITTDAKTKQVTQIPK